MQLFLDLAGLQALLLPLGLFLLVRRWVASSLSQRHPAPFYSGRTVTDDHSAARVQALLYGLRPYERWRLRHLPGPTPAFLTGNIAEIAALGGAALAHAKFSQRYGPVYSTFGAPQPWVVTDSPALAHDVLLQHTVRPTMPSLLSGKDREFDRANILAAVGDKHRSLRGAWLPLFYAGSLERYAVLMNEATTLLLAKLDRACQDERSMDVHAAFKQMTMQVVGTTAFGVDFTMVSLGAEDAELAEVQNLTAAANVVFDLQTGFESSVYMPLLFCFPFLAPLLRPLAALFPDLRLRRLRSARQVIMDSAFRLIKRQRLYMASQAGAVDSAAAVQRPCGSGTGTASAAPRRGVLPGSFLDLMTRATDRTTGRGFTDFETANQAYAMIMAGYESTANALAFTLYLLTLNRHKEASVIAEVLAFGSAVPSYADLARFPYMEAALKEALRVFPTAPTLVREASQAMTLGGYCLAKGQILAVSAYSMHHNPAYWVDPEAYLPERFIDGTPEAAARPEHGWVPFGGGVRGCPGGKFSMEEATIALIRMYQRFRFELEPGQVPMALHETITLSPAHGVRLNVFQA